MNYEKVVDECKKLETLTIFSTLDKSSELHEQIVKKGGVIFDILNPIGVTGENLQQFDKIIDGIWLNNDKSVYYLSRNTIKKYCIDVMRQIHHTDENDTKNHIELKTRWEKLLKKELTDYDVVFPLYGVTIDKITPIGLFTAYNANDYKNFVKSKGITEEILRETLFKEGANYLMLQIQAKDFSRAIELARPYFELFEYIAKFWLNNSLNFDIGIFEYKKWKIAKGLAFSNENVSAAFNETGSYKDVNILTLTNTPIMSRIWDIMQKHIQGKATQLELNLINAIRWVGMANNDDSNVTKHVQYVFALEALLTHRKKNELITPGIAHQLAESAAFIIGETANTKITTKKDLRKKVFHEVKLVYDIRSKIAHGNDSTVNAHEIIRARKIIYSLILAILQNENILKFQSMDEFDKWISDLRFSS